jgi:L-lactate dehydrogenase complex protein LldE
MAQVVLFVPCYMAVLRPVDAQHAERVLRALGDDVTVLSGPCCGQPAFNSGFRDEARTVGRELLRAARAHAAIVLPSGSCTGMVRHYLPGLFPGTRAAGAGRLASRFHEFTGYVSVHPALERLRFQLRGTVAFHDSCHARRELGLTPTELALLERVAGLDVRRLVHEAECCGFGGTFAVKEPQVASAMVGAKLADISGTGAHVVVSADLSCLAHLDSAARGLGVELETWTFAELLSRALP